MTNKEVAHIFIDEFGTNVYIADNPTVTSHFVYASLIIPESKLATARKIRQDLADKYHQGTAFSSKEFDKKDKKKSLQKRIDFLNDLVKMLDFTVDILVIDKKAIDGDGLKFKEIFYKYFQGLFVKKYNNRFESFHINADNIGSTEYGIELSKYINKNNIERDLFNPERFFRLKDDKIEEPILQLIDMICGSLGKFYSSSHFNQHSQNIYDILHTRISCEYFPKFEVANTFKLSNIELDNKIREISLASVDPEKIKLKDNQIAKRLVEYLQSHYKSNPKRFIQTYEIQEYLRNFEPDISTEKIRRLVRDLRYEGAFIISVSQQNGYKIAFDSSDIFEYFTHYSNYFIPMLQKIKIINQEIAKDSFNEFNILEKDETFILFKKLLSVID
ncbi:MAG: DUF3800 domain-containing protein [bacterium]|nr:DUF3800 domain-containing protein [bacterium]